MDAKKKICLILTTFFVLFFPFHLVLKAQAAWYDNHGPVSPPPDVGPPGHADGNNGNNTPYYPPSTPSTPAPSTEIKEAFVIAVCANAGDPTSGCLGKTVAKASLKLGGLFISSYLNGYLSDLFRLTVPNIYPQYQALRLLYFVEIRTINTVRAQIENDLRKVRAFNWPTEAEKARALIIIQRDEDTINKWNRKAREEANKGTNWSHNWNGNGNSSHVFHPGPAYKQLKTISSLGWLNR